jgi:hypothetical protein
MMEASLTSPSRGSLAAEDGEIADAYVKLCVHAGNAEAIKLIMETGENSDPQGGTD